MWLRVCHPRTPPDRPNEAKSCANRTLTGRDPRGAREHAEGAISNSPQPNQEAQKDQPGGGATVCAQRAACAAIAAVEASHT